MRTEGYRFGVKTSKTLRRVNPSQKMMELETILHSKCIKNNRIDYVYNENQIVETNEKYEKVDKCKKRVLANENKKKKKDQGSNSDSIEEEKSFKEFVEHQEELINEYNSLEYH